MLLRMSRAEVLMELRRRILPFFTTLRDALLLKYSLDDTIITRDES